ncbi:hypothetical protein E2C01_002269 [Portunus trituberculatus]|uniref:Uncharacterized protein n=1 Tax=Portunus trituberculatus TaxID=210409 RepID=A0A5B7CLU2_PORTR|nr:hypothetical protein [Portunus trituberculatus]
MTIKGKTSAPEGLTNFPEGSQLLPAGDERAGPRHAVTLAVHSSLADHSLHQDTITCNLILTFIGLLSPSINLPNLITRTQAFSVVS